MHIHSLGGGTQRSLLVRPSPFPSALIKRGDSWPPLPRVELIQQVSTIGIPINDHKRYVQSHALKRTRVSRVRSLLLAPRSLIDLLFSSVCPTIQRGKSLYSEVQYHLLTKHPKVTKPVY